MKKVLSAAVWMLLLAFAARSQTVPHYVYIPQYHYIPTGGGSGTSWQGHSLLSLYAGSGLFSQPNIGVRGASDYSAHVPLSVALRYATEADKGKHLFLGWFSEIGYYRFGYDYTYDGSAVVSHFSDGGTSVGYDVRNTRNVWSLSLEEDFVVGCNINRAFSITLSAGIYADLLAGSTLVKDFVSRDNGASTYRDEDNSLAGTLFSSVGFALRSEMRYFFSGPYFASLTANVYLPAHSRESDSPLGVNRYSLMLGVGYKAFNKKSAFIDD